MQLGIGYWAPYLLGTASAVLLVIATLPPMVSDAALFKRWYQTLLLGGAGLLVFGILFSVVASSPLVLLGLALIVAVGVAWQSAQMRARGHLAEEALEFLHGLISVMSADQGLREALRTVAQDPDFYAAYPRMTETVREVVAGMQAGTALSKALSTVAETAGASRPVWQQMATVARITEQDEERASVQEQADALEVSWEILFDVQAINQTLKQEMGSMEMAKWVFTLVLPALNVFMYFNVDGYHEVFFDTLIGKAVLGIEALAIVGIFVIFSRLQKLPEVRL
jgi:hypothetical protein